MPKKYVFSRILRCCKKVCHYINSKTFLDTRSIAYLNIKKNFFRHLNFYINKYSNTLAKFLSKLSRIIDLVFSKLNNHALWQSFHKNTLNSKFFIVFFKNLGNLSYLMFCTIALS